MLDQRELTLIGFNGSLTVTKQSPVWITADFGVSAPPSPYGQIRMYNSSDLPREQLVALLG